MSRAIETIRLSRLLPLIQQEFTKVPDVRDAEASALNHSLSDTLMAGLAMMFVQDPSMLSFQTRLQDRQRSNNLRTIFGIEELPKASQFGRILDNVDPAILQHAFTPVLQSLQKTRLWSEYRVLGGRYAVLMDGFEYFRSEKRGCPHCQEYRHRDGRVEHAHQVLATTLAHPTAKRPIPLLLEEIRREDGSEKQDCEFNAARRLIPKLTRAHPHLDLIYVGDGLFSKLPMVELIRDSRSSYILVAKPTDHKTLEQNLTGLRQIGGVTHWEQASEKGRRQVYEWATDLELVSTSAVKTNWYSYTEFFPNGKVAYRNSWITDLKPTKHNIRELVEVGRHRWQIEDQAFDVLKNHGYHLEHNYGHGENHLAFIYVILNFLAYMLHQLIALSDRLFQAAVEKVGSEYKLWADIRVLVSYFVWATWEALLEHILDYKHKTSLESG